MWADLARSGLSPMDLHVEPSEYNPLSQTASYIIWYPAAGMFRIRYDVKEVTEDTPKYKGPPGKVALWWPKDVRLDDYKGRSPIYLIEGEKKAAKFHKQWPHLPVFGMGGAHNALLKRGSPDAERELLPELAAVLQEGSELRVVFDSDIESKPNVASAARNLKGVLDKHKVQLQVMRPPVANGLDDWLVDCPEGELHDLIHIDFSKLPVAHDAVWEAAGVRKNFEGKITYNELNFSKLLSHVLFDEGPWTNDRRLGLMRDGRPATKDMLKLDALTLVRDTMLIDQPTLGRTITEAVGLIIGKVRSDFVKDYVMDIEWDKVPRLDSFGATFFKTGMPKSTAATVKFLFTSLAFRIINPGVKTDIITVIVGKQGIGKTTFFETLSQFGPYKFYALATEVPDPSRNKDVYLNAVRAVIMDFSEGIVFNSRRETAEHFKGFLSQTVDTVRKPYATEPVSIDRHFINVSSTNNSGFLSDPTGARRYAIIHAEAIPLPLTIELRDQLLAEVVARRAELEATEWWEPVLDLEEVRSILPPSITETYEHVTDPRVLMNLGNTKQNSYKDVEDALLELLELEVLPHVNGWQYITRKAFTAYLKTLDYSLAYGAMGDILKRCKESSTFPYELHETPTGYSSRPYPNIFIWPNEQVKYMFTNALGHPRSSFPPGGYYVRKKGQT